MRCVDIVNLELLNSWSQYPMWVISNLWINAWSLNLCYPCRVWPPRDIEIELNYSVSLHKIDIIAWFQDSQQKSSDSRFSWIKNKNYNSLKKIHMTIRLLFCEHGDEQYLFIDNISPYTLLYDFLISTIHFIVVY